MNNLHSPAKQLFYRLIYNCRINFVLRNINRWLAPVLPRSIRIPPSGTLTLAGTGGNKIRMKTNQTSYLTHLIYWEGGYRNFEYTSLFIPLIKKVRTFYDIGANIGYYSLIAASENPDIRVVGFEPAQGPWHYFRENIALNRFTNITPECLALSDRTGTIQFFEISNYKYKYLKYNLAGESNTGHRMEGRHYTVNEVRTVTLDEYCRLNHEEKIDLIKIDTEGTENLIFEHAGRVLGHMRPVVICETLFNTIEKELEAIFRHYGYLFFNHTGSGLRRVDTITREKDDGVRNCFFVHPEKMAWVEEFIAG